jgi:AcrR family transcriptional regulator
MNRSESPRPYHHGDLKAALLADAEVILERDGIQALTLRAAARAAGVSHAAPANHFGDLTGLLSELAAVGFRRFSAMLSAARATGGDRPAAARGMGHAYVTFARTYPNLFALMFRGERLDTNRPALREALDEAASVLRSAPGMPRLVACRRGRSRRRRQGGRWCTDSRCCCWTGGWRG